MECCRSDARSGAVFASRRRSRAFEPCEALELIDRVRHADLNAGSGDADGSDDKARPVLMPGEDMLYGSADL